jgi:hypothetical protein
MILFSEKKKQIVFNQLQITDFEIIQFVFEVKKSDRILLVPTNKLFILFDLHGKHFIEPETRFVFETTEISDIEANFLILEMPSIFFQTIETYEIGWHNILYFELLDGFNNNNLQVNKKFMDEVSKLIHNRFSFAEINKKEVGERQKRRYYKTLGINKALLKRIERFEKAVNNFDDSMGKFDLSEYADQSHFIRECKQFTGFTPEKLLKLTGNVRFIQYEI